MKLGRMREEQTPRTGNLFFTHNWQYTFSDLLKTELAINMLDLHVF
jgi:hypothetical protein